MRTKATEVAAGREPGLVPFGVAAERLLAAEHPTDQRKGRDVNVVDALRRGPWEGQIIPVGVGEGKKQSLRLVLNMCGITGLVWNGKPELHDRWLVEVGLPLDYPLDMPKITFRRVIPFAAHIVHPAPGLAPDPRTLPADLRHHVEALREGHAGEACYARRSEWRSTPDFDVARALHQVSRLLTGAVLFGEGEASLNESAARHYLRLKADGRLPLGPALPFPHADGAAAGAPGPAGADEADDDSVEWL